MSANALGQQHEVVVMHPDQFAAFNNSGYCSTKGLIALDIGVPALGCVIHACREVVEEGPESLIGVAFVEIAGASHINGDVTVAISGGGKKFFPLLRINRAVVSGPSDPH